jgi:hypothetical protein
MSEDIKSGMTSAILRLNGNDGGWVPLHVTISRVELDEGIFGGMVALRLPTDVELAEVGMTFLGGISS